MKLNISEGTKKLLCYLVGLVIVTAAFFLGFQNFKGLNEQLKLQKEALEAELEQLNKIELRQNEYEANTKAYTEKIADYYEQFPALVQARDQILYAADLESRYNSMFISRLDMGTAEYVTGTENDAMVLYQVPTVMECEVNYKQLKDFLINTSKDGTRKSVKEIVLTTDETTGNLIGQINISMYYMTGTKQAYQPQEIEDVKTGTKNIFQRGVTALPQQ